MDAEAYLALDDLKTDVVKDVPGWGDVRIKALDGAEREELESLISAVKAGKPVKFLVRATATAFAVINLDGSKVFNRTHIPRLAKKSGEALDRIMDKVLDISGMTDAARAAMAKNSGTVRDGSSGSSSPELSPTPASEEPKN